MRFSPYVLACFLAFATPASAQQEEAFDLGTIVLRGELQDRTIQDSPTSAAVITDESLDRRADQNLDNIYERTPGVNLPAGRVGLTIRGISEGGLAVGGSGLLISTQVDGAALPGVFATIFGADSTWDLEQVEVLRGSQSTQQGRNALGGAVVVRSADPVFDHEYRLRGEIANRNAYRVALVANTPLIEDRLALRFSFEQLENDGYVFNPVLNDDRFDAQRMITQRLKLRWQATDSLEAILSYSHTNNRAGEDFVNAGSFPLARINRSGVPAGEGAQHDNFGLRLNWDINESFRLESETTFYVVDYFRVEDFDGSPLNLAFTTSSQRPQSLEQDLQLKFDFDSVSGVVGLFFTRIENRNNGVGFSDVGFITGVGPTGIVFNSVDFADGTTENFAVFGEVDIKADRWLPGLSFTAGARYDFERFDNFSINTLTNQATGMLIDTVVTRNSADFDAFLPKGGVRYAWSDTQSAAFTVQRGYRAGGVSNNLTAALTPGFNPSLDFDPEFTTTYELAYRGSFYDDRMRVAANAFYTRWTDQQVTQQGRVTGDANNTQDRDIVNAGTSELYGGEISVEGEVNANISLYGSVAYVQTRFLDFVINPGSASQQVLNGNEFPSAPKFSASIGGAYAWNNGITLAVDASYQDASFENIQNTLRDDARFLVNAQLTYETQNGWLTGIYARNIFDRDYVTLNSNNLQSVRTGEPRTIGVFAEKTF